MNAERRQVIEMCQRLLRQRDLGLAVETLEEIKPRLILTARELRIAAMVADGKCAKDIAVTLNLSYKTVEAHRCNIYSKIGLHGSVDLAHWALRHRLIGNKYEDQPSYGIGSVNLHDVIRDPQRITAAWAEVG